MRVKVTKKQFLLLLDNFWILSDKGLELNLDVRTLNFVFNDE